MHSFGGAAFPDVASPGRLGPGPRYAVPCDSRASEVGAHSRPFSRGGIQLGKLVGLSEWSLPVKGF